MHLIYSPLAKGLFQGAFSEGAGARAAGAPERLGATTLSGPMNSNPPVFRPVLDRRVKPWTYEQALAGGHLNHVPVPAGGNKEEALPRHHRHRHRGRPDPQRLCPRGLTCRRQPMAAEWAKTAKSPVFTYYWDHVPRTATGPNSRGAYQGSEINYVFDNL